ncbi:unnamed protein product (macronuclear) [Paramecium tetraurelia]|uniref:Uncharacterized protein n=1 Tax=Paramecium tetraurelia TaxID=5888 RepID=A0CH33_PARTE|nr:uncharacterized protein GSPATT00007540001 [Paramecium tetraurelia]CAK70100.1 unnamed protein product [Paramecium tetraurelia]|eukprot:XP_001437497.1 hypothetical protein (macronuclear) [Paramecium tetraurelia strain d4-2]
MDRKQTIQFIHKFLKILIQSYLDLGPEVARYLLFSDQNQQIQCQLLNSLELHHFYNFLSLLLVYTVPIFISNKKCCLLQTIFQQGYRNSNSRCTLNLEIQSKGNQCLYSLKILFSGSKVKMLIFTGFIQSKRSSLFRNDKLVDLAYQNDHNQIAAILEYQQLWNIFGFSWTSHIELYKLLNCSIISLTGINDPNCTLLNCNSPDMINQVYKKQCIKLIAKQRRFLIAKEFDQSTYFKHLSQFGTMLNQSSDQKIRVL